MSIEEKYKQNNLELQDKVRSEIKNSQTGISRKSIDQLINILEELEMAYEQRGNRLSFPRFIVDSWDYTDNLGIELLNLAELYEKLG